MGKQLASIVLALVTVITTPGCVLVLAVGSNQGKIPQDTDVTILAIPGVLAAVALGLCISAVVIALATENEGRREAALRIAGGTALAIVGLLIVG
jgi:high-affinity Fe2+/Pb2+ permease